MERDAPALEVHNTSFHNQAITNYDNLDYYACTIVSVSQCWFHECNGQGLDECEIDWLNYSTPLVITKTQHTG